MTTESDVTLFDDLADYVAIPRASGAKLSPDGAWLAVAVQTLSVDRKKYVTSIWRVDTGGGAPRRLTRSAEGEGNPRFLPDGSVLFTSKRPNPDAKPRDEDDPEGALLWLLPAGGGEARVIASLPGGVAVAEVAARSGAVVVSSPMLPTAGNGAAGTSSVDNGTAGNGAVGNGTAGNGAGDGSAEGKDSAADDARLRKARRDAGVSAILHESVPVRYWDHDLGPADLRLFALRDDEGSEGSGALTDLTPDAGRAFLQQSFDVSPDGSQLAIGWWRWDPVGQSYVELTLIDTETGTRTVLASDPEYGFEDPRFSPDGRYIACVRTRHHTAEQAMDATLVLIDTQDKSRQDLTPDLDRWPHSPTWAPDSSAIYFTADDEGRIPVFRVGLAAREVTKVTTDDGAYSDLNASSEGTALYAMRAAIGEPPTPVRIDLATGAPTRLNCPGSPLALPGSLTEVSATAEDGQPIRSWLALPDGASEQSPAPLVLWVHGGPMMSFNSWSWRWNPWLLVAKGYAVLLPDPALSTGYGHAFVQRGYHEWGPRPFGDIMAATDAAVKRPDIDESRTAMMGGSYGGYMANWIAGHTDRFRAIVSHAGLWVLDQMFGTTDMPMFWRPQFGDPLTNEQKYRENSPHRYIDKISTPMLVIHGNRDFRVPVGEALRLWWDLSRFGADAKFLYFPDENHWILTPGNAAVWYETVRAFLAQHVLGEPWRRPDLL